MSSQFFNYNPNATLQTSMPQMGATLSGWEVPLQLDKLTQGIDRGLVTTLIETINFQGVWQPLKDEQLQFKPEGQRSWTWIWIHAKAGTLNLTTQDKVIFNDKRYKVMTVKDYSLNGYIEYELVLDFGVNV